MVGMDHVTLQTLITQLGDHLQLSTSLTHKHQSLRPGVTLCRVANSHVKTLAELRSLHIKISSSLVGHFGPHVTKPKTT